MQYAPLSYLLAEQPHHEYARIVATAKELFLQRGIEAVALADVAIRLFMPLEAIEQHFPAGKPAVVQAAVRYHLSNICEHLTQQQHDCANAVEELLALRRFAQQGIADAGVLVFRELEAYYPLSWRYLRYVRARFMGRYLRANLLRGIREGLYHPGLAPEALSRQWLRQVGNQQAAARTPAELATARYAHLNQFLAAITTPVGAYVLQRLQEAPPYY